MFGWGKNLLICKGELFFETESHGLFILFAISEGAHQLGKNLKLYLYSLYPFLGEHITDTYITETDATELEKLSQNIIYIFIIET